MDDFDDDAFPSVDSSFLFDPDLSTVLFADGIDTAGPTTDLPGKSQTLPIPKDYRAHTPLPSPEPSSAFVGAEFVTSLTNALPAHPQPPSETTHRTSLKPTENPSSSLSDASQVLLINGSVIKLTAVEAARRRADAAREAFKVAELAKTGEGMARRGEEERKRMNKVAAVASRVRKSEYVGVLEECLRKYERERGELMERRERLRAESEAIRVRVNEKKKSRDSRQVEDIKSTTAA